MRVFLNGKFIEDSQATVSIYDRGFLYGDGVFETLRIYPKGTFLLDKHLERLFKGLETLQIRTEFDKRYLSEKVKEIIDVNNLKEGALRITVTRGTGERGIVPPRRTSPTLLITATGYKAPEEELYREGVELGLSEKPNNRLPEDAHLKSLNFLNNIIARLRCDQRYFDCLMLNPQGEVTETTVSNFFFFKNNTLYTPSVECGILKGITRQVVIEIGRKAGINVVEDRFPIEAVYEAEETFLTNSLIEVLPVKRLKKKSFNKPDLSIFLRERYRKIILSGDA